MSFFDNVFGTWWGILIFITVVVIVAVILSIVFYRHFFKRFYDILFSLIAIIICLPLFLLLIISGSIKMGGNPFFIQERPGKNEKIFKMLKFRTMNNKRDENGNLLSDELRLTKYGKFLRKTSLDELPEFFNILSGQMSLIGPRPLLIQYLPLYNERQKQRHKVRPGLTGLAQATGRNSLSWDEKLEKDFFYVNNISFLGDIKILFLTVKSVFIREGISEAGQATMRAFNGNKKESKNVLILSAGRRVELIKAFKQARDKLNIGGNVVAADMNKSAPSLYFADKFELIAPVKSENYIENLIEIALLNKIDLIIPTIDTELPILSKNKELIESKTGAQVMVSDTPCIEYCGDKIKTAEFFEKYNFNSPKTLTDNEIKTHTGFPLFIKPRNGSSSINAFVVKNKSELDFFINYVPDPIVQEMLKGQEYTIDIFCDFNNNAITIVPRKRLAIRSGETLKGQIEKNSLIIEECKRLINIMKPVGAITVQGFLCDNIFYFLEINPRFGGGAPMSIKAGADSCYNLYSLLLNRTLSYNEDYADGAIFSRFDDSVLIPND